MRALGQTERYTVNLPTIALSGIVSLSFLLHFFLSLFSGYVYAIVLVACTILFVFSKRVVFRKNNAFAFTCFINLIILVFSFLHSQRSNGALLDVIIFFCGLLLIVCCSETTDIYLRCFSTIKFFAIFFSVGVILQKSMPSVYKSILSVFPSAFRETVTSSNGSGFTGNPGFSAGYIIAGLFVLLSELGIGKQSGAKKAFFPLLLLVALLLTSKRGPTAFFFLTAIFCYLVPVKGSRKIKRFWRLFLIVFFSVIFLLIFGDALSSITIIGRFSKTISQAMAGEDITSGRSRLYIWAWELFKRNPVLGIGWGRFRTTVVGNVTLVKDLEAHNIYLQLLAETGIIGFISFMTVFLLFWNTARITYCECFHRDTPHMREWRILLFFSLAYQTFFLLYGLTGNPLYDPHFQLIYFFSCMITAAYKFAKDEPFDD